MVVYAKGRLLSNLDTWLVTLSDTPLEPPKAATKPKAAPKLEPLPAKGKIEGKAGELFPKLSMFDLILPDRTLHVTYSLETQFFYQDRPALAGSLESGMRCVVAYSRDKSGRIVASRVELFPASSP
jgi:hypothetical protein